MILERGDLILVVHRRLFETDRARFFVGTVEDYERAIVRVSGTTWIQDAFHGKMVKKEGSRTKLISLSSGTLLVYLLPAKIALEKVRIDYDRNGQIELTDGSDYHLDLSEGLRGQASAQK